ncbi:putative RNA-binding protein [Lachnellula suecica]|uniref:U4/U6 snRNA-associated-splicing factor PRP24 n=1 Tax=Lachnellula suecica TaxID=602035 RepID=A0A8T9BSL8_9HELO|nr:putative RNA-binding protein [Lachnellula suecica]
MADPVGEDSWLALVDEASRTAVELVQRIEVVELYKRAIVAEPWSLKLWLAYCEWFWSLHTDCQNGDAGWPEEEQIFGQESFTLESALDIWQEGALATKYRLNDSHELWNRWISIEEEQLAKSPSPERMERVRGLFLDRLQVPHAAWDETSSKFSQFITKYDESAWESTMVHVTKVAQPAKDLYSKREDHELKLGRAADSESLVAAMREYLEWEIVQTIRKPKKGSTNPVIFCVALFERALASTPLGLEGSTWEDYLTFISTADKSQASSLPSTLSVVQRAVRHCPWSGNLWARYILAAELENLAFEDMEQIKHAATNTRELDRDGMDGVIEFYVAWAGYLKRRTMGPNVSEEAVDVAEMGLPSALESIQDWGQRREGVAEWKGDPHFRIERIFIQYLTQRASYEEARGYWKRGVKTRGDSYEFWQQYYLWEMTVRPSTTEVPTTATAVLLQAVHRRQMDWPEKILEMYLRHCNLHEEVETLVTARALVYRLSKEIAKRRQEEAAQAAAYYGQPVVAETSATEESTSGASKRKREETPGDTEGSAKKKARSVDIEREQNLKRDRENTTILVEGLPADVTQNKVKLYFKDYGHVNNITVKREADELSSTALIEFRTAEEAQSALLRDKKYFGDRQLHVEPGTRLTLYVTNYPPTADDAYLRNLFKDCGEIFSIRWPSLKFKSTRRFCYISFRTQQAAAAATQMDGHALGGIYKLVAKYSDPANKKDREGATAEGREIHITGIDESLTADDLKEVFAKYGKIERVNLLKNMSGRSKGAGFVSFAKKEEATAALELDKTKLKSRVLTVEVSTGTNFKATATIKGVSASPAPEGDGGSIASPSPAPEGQNGHPRSDYRDRTIALMNLPDTVNDARVNALAAPYGEIVKLVLRHDHQGATIEYADVAAAGRAFLGLDNHEIAPGRKLRTGSVKELFAQKGEVKAMGGGTNLKENKKPQPSFMQPSAPVKRPGPGGRGGLGVKRGLGFVAPKAVAAAPKEGDTNGMAKEEGKKVKSNADFKALFVSGGSQ